MALLRTTPPENSSSDFLELFYALIKLKPKKIRRMRLRAFRRPKVYKSPKLTYAVCDYILNDGFDPETYVPGPAPQPKKKKSQQVVEVKPCYTPISKPKPEPEPEPIELQGAKGLEATELIYKKLHDLLDQGGWLPAGIPGIWSQKVYRVFNTARKAFYKSNPNPGLRKVLIDFFESVGRSARSFLKNAIHVLLLDDWKKDAIRKGELAIRKCFRKLFAGEVKFFSPEKTRERVMLTESYEERMIREAREQGERHMLERYSL